MTRDVSVEIEKINEQIGRWQSKLRRAVNAIKKLDAKRKRLVRKSLPISKEPPIAIVTINQTNKPGEQVTAVKAVETDHLNESQFATVAKALDDPLDIPAYLLRSQPNEADEKAKAEILAEKEAKKKVKAKASSERSRARARGELRKMPLQGKAALAAIRGE